MFGSNLLRAFDAAVMPSRCAFCGMRTRSDEVAVCKGCYGDLPWAGPPPSISPFCAVVVPLTYEFPVDAAIKALKFRRRLWYGPALGGLLHDALAALPSGIDAVLPVPLHWWRRWLRGFNQAQEIARPVARQLGAPIIGGARRLRATRSQSGLSAPERRRNVQGAFAAVRACRARHVLIVDDVITTGATIRQLGRVVLASGAEKVSAAAVARASGGMGT